MGKVKDKSNKQKNALYNTQMLYKAQNIVIKFFDNSSLMITEANYKRIHGKEIKILKSKKVLSKWF